MGSADTIIVNKIKEKAALLGVENLSDKELVALLIKTGDEIKQVDTLSENLLRRYGSLREISRLAPEEIKNENKGMSLNKAITLKAALEAGKRAQSVRAKGEMVKTSYDIAKVVMPLFFFFLKENFMVAVLNTKNCIIGLETVSVGTLNSSLAHPREVFRIAISKCANAIILVHNHPSGDPLPSNEDKRVTRQMWDAGKILNIGVLDHIIVGGENYFSFADAGIMPDEKKTSASFLKNKKLAQNIV